jgi:hypothetical protein
VRIAVGPHGEELVPTAEEAERAAKEAERAAKEAERAAKEAALVRVSELEAEAAAPAAPPAPLRPGFANYGWRRLSTRWLTSTAGSGRRRYRVLTAVLLR